MCLILPRFSKLTIPSKSLRHAVNAARAFRPRVSTFRKKEIGAGDFVRNAKSAKNEIGGGIMNCMAMSYDKEITSGETGPILKNDGSWRNNNSRGESGIASISRRTSSDIINLTEES